MSSFLELIKEKFGSSGVVHTLSSRMLKNSEFNAVQEIREFFKKESLFDFELLSNASKRYLDCKIIYNLKVIRSQLRLGFPPNKREARMWIYDLNKFVNANESIYIVKYQDEILVIPLNQSQNQIIRQEVNIDNVKWSKNVEEKSEFKSKQKQFKAYKIDYLEKYLRNKEVGLDGELFVIAHEMEYLSSKGKHDLIKKIKHKSVLEGDGIGYDILSFDENENERHIEVKTTTSSCSTPFFLSENELSYCKGYPHLFFIYRVYELSEDRKSARIKMISGKDINQYIVSSNSYKCVIEG